MIGCRSGAGPWRLALWAWLLVFLVGGASPAWCRPEGPSAECFPSLRPDALASGILGTPMIVGSTTLQLICLPEFLEVRAPGFARPWLGSEPLAVFGRVRPQDLIVTGNGSQSIIRLDEPSAGIAEWLDWIREVASSAEVVGMRKSREGGEAFHSLWEQVAGSEVSRRFWVLAWLGWTLGLLFLSIPVSGLVWRSALACVARPLASIVAGIGAILLVVGCAAGSLHAGEAMLVLVVPALAISFLALMPLLAILPLIVAASLVKRLLAPMSLLTGLGGLCAALPLVTILPLFGRPGTVALAVLCIWALGGVLLSRIPGTGHEIPQKEESHVQKILDPDACRPVADHGGLRPGNGQPDASADARQSGDDPQAESPCQHGPGGADRRG